MTKSKYKKLAVLNNHITPYRVPLYRGLSQHFSTFLLLSGREANRDTWQDLEKDISGVDIRTVWGVTLEFFKKRKGEKFDPRYFHINPGYFWELLKIRPDALISAEMGFRSLVALLYGFLFSKPVWILWGGTLHTEQNRSAFKRLIRFLIFKNVTRWISYGETTTEYLLALGIRQQHILQIQNCIDEQQFTSASTHATITVSPSPVLLYTGQLIKRKGIDLFLKAASSLQQKGRIFSILVVGNGLEKKNLVGLAEKLELRNITFLSGQQPSDMPAVYQSADVLVFPTLEDVWGLVVNEALWSGLTVVSSMYAGCAPEILPEANVFDPLDHMSFEDILEKAINGELLPANCDDLLTVKQVVEMIAERINTEVALKNIATDLIESTAHQ